MFSDDEKEVEIERAKQGIQPPRESAHKFWAGTVGFVMFLAFIILIIFMGHHHWGF
jgi:hypothetical protein